MKRPYRPFDEKPAAECQICGTPIGDGELCLHCLPAADREGNGAWFRHRWFSGRHVELRKRRIALQEGLRRTAAMAAAAAVLLTGLSYSLPKARATWSAYDAKPVHAQKQSSGSHQTEIAVKMT